MFLGRESASIDCGSPVKTLVGPSWVLMTSIAGCCSPYCRALRWRDPEILVAHCDWSTTASVCFMVVE